MKLKGHKMKDGRTEKMSMEKKEPFWDTSSHTIVCIKQF